MGGMNPFTFRGIAMFVGAFFALLFQWLSTLMQKPEWEYIVLGDIGYDMWVSISDKLPSGFLQNSFDYIVFELSLWILLAIVGTLFIIAGMFIKE